MHGMAEQAPCLKELKAAGKTLIIYYVSALTSKASDIKAQAAMLLLMGTL
jgi:hypothetical protein